MTTSPTRPTFGLYLNFGANLGQTPDEVFDLSIAEADLAHDCGYDELWLTEHHFIRFGINPSSLTAAGFFLGRSDRMRVGTAVTLSPLLHPVEIAERAALLDQLSGGRFDLGIGRGGYLRDYEVLGVDVARWDEEPATTARILLDAWQNAEASSSASGVGFDPVRVEPRPFTTPHPPLLMGTTSTPALEFAAANNLALQHYFATPADARVAVEQGYAALQASNGASASTPPRHLHCLMVVVTDDEAATRERLTRQLMQSFRDGDHPHVPQAPQRHVDADGKPFDRDAMATWVANQAIVGRPSAVVDRLGEFLATTGASRLALYMEAVADRPTILSSIERFAADVAPQLGLAGGTPSKTVMS